MVHKDKYIQYLEILRVSFHIQLAQRRCHTYASSGDI